MASKSTSVAQLHTAAIPQQKTTPSVASAISLAHQNYRGDDILQVVNGSGKIVFSLSSAGTASFNPTAPTTQALLGRHFGSSLQACFPGSNDVYQIEMNGGTVMHLDNAGVVWNS